MNEGRENDLEKIADVLVAMSGGVDSTVCAKLLVDEGYEAVGVTMSLFGNELIGEDAHSTCCSVDDVEDARKACAALGIEHYTFNMRDRFKSDVVDRFCDTYMSGGTPNPCIDCNRYLKFAALQQRRRELGAEYVATGHYVRRVFDEGSQKWQLHRGVDRNKDQSYVLYDLTQDDLTHMLFPLGEFTKDQIREMARESGFGNAEKDESQDICFVPDGDYRGFIERYVAPDPEKPPFIEGEIVDVQGNRLGKHSGLVNYTIGQRKGIGIAHPEPLYVCEIRVDSNELVVGERDDLLVNGARVKDVNIISGDYTPRIFDAEVQTGYRQRPVAAQVELADDKTALVKFEAPHARTAPGQSIVFYDGDRVIGGGIAC